MSISDLGTNRSLVTKNIFLLCVLDQFYEIYSYVAMFDIINIMQIYNYNGNSRYLKILPQVLFKLKIEKKSINLNKKNLVQATAYLYKVYMYNIMYHPTYILNNK